ncbi:MAG TPA: hypothetical protein VFZ28_08085 [Burkholderiaceae bacterium]|nr:hypothetical protein [Burkholderiaceae bacterium]
MNAAAPRLAVVLDDVAAAAAPLVWSSALARALQRELQVVYVESTSVLDAAALPIARALAHLGTGWAPYGRADVERAYRQQVVRLQALMQRLGLEGSLRSLQVVRGTLHGAALDVGSESDLVLVSTAARWPAAPAGEPRCHSVQVWADDSEQGLLLLELATRCARSLGAMPRVVRARTQVEPGEVERARADLLVLSRAAVSARVLAAARRPLLLVGRKD